MPNHNIIKLYGLFDAALMPKVWLNLESWLLPNEPLYRSNYQAAAEVIPYLIELNKDIDENAVNELLNLSDYQQGLFISSELTLDKLVERLGYFYHVIDTQNKPCLRRFFDLRIFANFLATLTPIHCTYLFGHQTIFYYKDCIDDIYHVVCYRDNQLQWFQKETLDFDTHVKGV